MNSARVIYHQLEVICPISDESKLTDMIYLLDPLSVSVIPISEETVMLQALFLEPKNTEALENVTWRVLSDDMWNQADISTLNGLTLHCPKTVFGHGLHPTTTLCLDALETRMKDETKRSLLHLVDVGTGSGVLSLVAWDMGIRSIEAIDIDPFAIQIAKENAIRNKISDTMFMTSDLFSWEPRQEADLLIANLPIEILEPGLTRLLSWLTPSGQIIISGIGTHWCASVEKILLSKVANFSKKELDGWGCYLCKVHHKINPILS